MKIERVYKLELTESEVTTLISALGFGVLVEDNRYTKEMIDIQTKLEESVK